MVSLLLLIVLMMWWWWWWWLLLLLEVVFQFQFISVSLGVHRRILRDLCALCGRKTPAMR